MPRPSVLTFNELNGEEVRQILENRFEQIVAEVPYFQHHLTLPRVRVTLNVKLEIWADQPQPETKKFGESVTVEVLAKPAYELEGESIDSTAPIPGGFPPDQVREMHGLAVSEPGPGPREVGGHIATSDRFMLDGREVEGGHPGLKISRTGDGVIDGMTGPQGATIAKIDQGPAGLRAGQMNRERMHFGGSNRK